MEDAYSDEQFSTIVASFKKKEHFDSARFRRALEGCAYIYLEGKNLIIERPSERVKQIEHLRKNAAASPKVCANRRTILSLNVFLMNWDCWFIEECCFFRTKERK